MAGSNPLWDGIWFGYVEELRPDAVVFNLACFYFGDTAITEAAKDSVIPVSDRYIRNVVPLTWELWFQPQAVVYVIDASGSGGFTAIPHSLWPAYSGMPMLCPGTSCGVWLYLNSGLVTAMVEYLG